MIPTGTRPIERRITAETLAAAMRPTAVRSIQMRLEQILIDDRELLIALQCQLEQIHREIRLLNDERIVSALGREDPPIRN